MRGPYAARMSDPAGKPWSGWHHVVITTYGQWVPGDPRGFRTRRHREHVEGDYKSPPQADYRERLAGSRQSMTRAPVRLDPAKQTLVAKAMGRRLCETGVEVAIMAVTATHAHLLLRIEDPRIAMRGLCDGNALQDGRNPLIRHVVGLAKKHASHEIRRAGLGVRGGIWGRRGKVVPIADRKHQVNVYRYIERHAQEGAALWRPKDSG